MAEIDLRNQNNVRDMLPHKPMRLSMENKNLLSKKGDIYVGTGESQTVIIEDDTYTIAETAKVSVPSEVISSNESAILIYDTTNNLQYKKSSESGFLSYTVDQTGTIKDPSGQGTGPKTTLLNNIFNSLTKDQKGYVRSQIGAAAVSDLTFVSYMVEQGLNDGQKSTARKNIGAAAVSDLTFLSYTVDQTGTIKDPSGQGTGPKTRLLTNIFDNLTDAQKGYVRSQIGVGAAQSITAITAGNGIEVGGQAYSPKVSVNLATNSGLVFDSSSKKLKLSVNSTVQSGNKYWVKIDENNHPYVNVSVPSGNNQTIAYASTTTSSNITVFGNNATVKLVPGNNINMTANTTNNYIQIDATDTQYSAAKGGGIKLEGTSFSLDTGIITTNKDYAVALNSEGVPYVHVDWMNTTYTAGSGISVADGAISVNLAQNSGMEFSSNQLKLKIGNVTGEKNYAVKLQNGIPYVNVPWMNTTYTGGNGISIAGGAISLAEGYNVPIEYQSSASSTADFASNKLYLIGTWTGV